MALSMITGRVGRALGVNVEVAGASAKGADEVCELGDPVPPTTRATTVLTVGEAHLRSTMTRSQSVAVPVTRILAGTGLPIPKTEVIVTLQAINDFSGLARHTGRITRRHRHQGIR